MKTFAILQSVVLGLSATAAALNADDTVDCRARAWVRAPDLEPGQVLRGDVRIKLDGACSDVSSYSIGLRFMERSWVKTRREGVILPDPPIKTEASFNPTISNDSIFEPLTFESFGDGVEKSARETYQTILKDPKLWLAREEERVGFETRYIIREGERLGHEIIDEFGLLVPFTNYPPAFDTSFGMFGRLPEGVDIGDSEHIYSYFVDVKFANGTHCEVPAGFTSFKAVVNPGQSREIETVKAVASRSSSCKMKHNCPSETKEAPLDEFTLLVTFPNGRNVARGSFNNVTLVVYQTGPGLQRPLGLKSLSTRVQQNLNWAATFAADNETAEKLLTSGSNIQSQLFSVMDDDMFYRQFFYDWVGSLESPRFPKTRGLKNGRGFSTEAITVHFKVPQSCYPSFVTNYQTTKISLEITLEVQNGSSTNNNILEDDFPWTPVKEETEEFQATIPLFVHTQPETDGLFEDEPIHYLSPDARSPVFVTPSSISELQLRSRDDRDKLAPIAQGKVTMVDHDIVKHRYYGAALTLRGVYTAPPYYVGDIWLRKVLAKDNSGGLQAQSSPLMVQT